MTLMCDFDWLKKGMLRAMIIASVSWYTLACGDTGHAQELTPTERKAILDEIEKIEKTLNDSKGKNNIRVLGQLREAVATPQSALKYYLQRVKSSEWDELGKRESEWKEWRDAEDDFKDSGYAKARQYQLRYMILTIRASMLDEDDDSGRAKMLTEVVEFLNGVVSNFRDVVNHADVLRGSVLSSTIARDTKLAVTLDVPDHWTETPLSINSIYDGTILPFYREKRNPGSLRKAWENRISQLTTLAETVEPVKISTRGKGGASGSGRRGDSSPDRDKIREQRKDKAEEAEVRIAEFRKNELPDLEWEMERDAFVFGANRSAAARKLGSHIRRHLDHHSAPGWINELKKLASGDFKIEDYLDEEEEEVDDNIPR